MKKFQIVIPNWNQSELCIKCLQSIKKYSTNYEVIFVDNGSEVSEFKKILQVLKTMPHKAILNKSNLGFVKATNQGLALCDSEYIVLMNNDTEAVDGWLEKLSKPLMENSNCVISGGLTTTKDSWQGCYVPKNDLPYIILPKPRMVAFFCTMFSKKVFDAIGFLDEGFGVGFGDDDDFCMRTQKHGFDIALVQNVRIPHHHRSTFKKIYEQNTIKDMQTKALQKFKNKHGVFS